MNKLANEPVLLAFVVLLFAMVLAAFALGLTEAQMLAGVAIVGGLLALVVRSKVSPVD